MKAMETETLCCSKIGLYNLSLKAKVTFLVMWLLVSSVVSVGLSTLTGSVINGSAAVYNGRTFLTGQAPRIAVQPVTIVSSAGVTKTETGAPTKPKTLGTTNKIASPKEIATGSKPMSFEKVVGIDGKTTYVSSNYIANNGAAIPLEEVVVGGAKTSTSWANTSGILRDAVKGKGNYGLGSGTFDDAMQAGRSWVGEGFTISKDGSSWISSNGLRQFRPPSFKPNLGIEQANFQWRNIGKGAWQSNGHLNIIKP